jgi:hypothetical protein
MRNPLLTVLKTLGALVCIIGCLGFFVPFFFASLPAHIELPLGDALGIALDSQGNIYCGSRNYCRVQAYDPNGRFMRAFNTTVGVRRGGKFAFSISKDDQLLIRLHRVALPRGGRGDRLIVYDLRGDLISAGDFPGTMSVRARNRTRDSLGNIYTLEGALSPKVIKQTPSGRKSDIVTTPIWLWIFQAPLPAWAFLLIGFLPAALLRAISKWRLRRRHKQLLDPFKSSRLSGISRTDMPEKCEFCQTLLPRAQKPRVIKDHVLCHDCYHKIKEQKELPD